jgi:hypothetical protein
MELFNPTGTAPDGSDIRKNFETWFAASIVSEGGAPIVVFHGSHQKFDRFDMDRSKDGAHFFTKDKEHAESFGPARAFVLSIQNPMFIHDDDLMNSWDAAHPDGMQDDRYLLPRDFVADFVEIAKSKGHDGLIIKDMGDRDISTDMYLPFDPAQIKSADFNNGLYDKGCADFTDASSELISAIVTEVEAPRRRMKSP